MDSNIANSKKTTQSLIKQSTINNEVLNYDWLNVEIKVALLAISSHAIEPVFCFLDWNIIGLKYLFLSNENVTKRNNQHLLCIRV